MTERVITFETEAGGERLDKVIAAALSELSRTQIQRLIDDGFVTLNGRAATKPGQRLERASTV